MLLLLRINGFTPLLSCEGDAHGVRPRAAAGTVLVIAPVTNQKPDRLATGFVPLFAGAGQKLLRRRRRNTIRDGRFGVPKTDVGIFLRKHR